jgi:outer membrane protein assembly factor BamA
MRRFLLLLVGAIVLGSVQAAVPSDTTRKASLIPLPLVFFTPETDWGFGAAAVYSFNFKSDSLGSRPSQLQLGFAYTLRDQILAYFPFQLFVRNDRYKFYGELGYYRYIYEFYGIGNRNLLEDGELFSVNFPRVRLNALQQVRPNLFLGLRYWLDDYDITELKAGGRLATEEIPGAAGSFLSGLGFIANYDNRDKIFFPSKGYFAELVLFNNSSVFGSDFNYSKLILDASTFKTLPWKHIVAANFYAELTSGEPPFNQLSLLGGPKRMRGYFEGRYRDKQYFAFQVEYRMPLFWRFGLTLFGGYGLVGDDFASFQTENLLYSLGAGLRFELDTERKVNIRFDAGYGKKSSGMYITVAEAF